MDAHTLFASQRRVEEFEKNLASYSQYRVFHQSINNKAK
jgi:hypothetical protein